MPEKVHHFPIDLALDPKSACLQKFWRCPRHNCTCAALRKQSRDHFRRDHRISSHRERYVLADHRAGHWGAARAAFVAGWRIDDTKHSFTKKRINICSYTNRKILKLNIFYQYHTASYNLITHARLKTKPKHVVMVMEISTSQLEIRIS